MAGLAEGGLSSDNPEYWARERLESKLVVRIFRDVRLACNLARFAKRQKVSWSWPLGNSGPTILSYSPSTPSKNPTSPFQLGPETAAGGVTLPRSSPFLFCSDGMKSVVTNRKWSS